MGMKIAISISDDLFSEAERLASRLGTSRSELYQRALAEYLARHAPAEVTEAVDRALDQISEVAEAAPESTFSARAARRALERTEW